MLHPVLTSVGSERQSATSVHDQMQIALAIADESVLRSLLVNCTPPIAAAHQIGAIASAIGVPLEAKQSVDGILSFEEIHCCLAESPAEIEQKVSAAAAVSNYRNGKQREYDKLTRCESETHILGQTMPLAQALSLLHYAGFSAKQVEEILNLPYEAWHKSWWYAIDPDGCFTVPFLRLMRTLRYTDGTFTLQYKDYFGQDKPTCFKSQTQKVLVEIQPEAYCFHETLQKINYSRAQLGVGKAVLVCDRLSELEARGFISQGISLYTAAELILPTQANCSLCITPDCPLSGRADTPVLMCRRFCLQAE